MLGTREMRCRVTGPARGPVLDNSVAINWAERDGFERKVAVSSGWAGAGAGGTSGLGLGGGWDFSRWRQEQRGTRMEVR